MRIRITCINKSSGNHENPHEAISYLGWIEEVTNKQGKTSRVEMYDWILKGVVAYVEDAYGNIAFLVAEVSSKGTKFVKTRTDGTKSDNLLSLPECK